jgi:hypothetical protein
MKTGFELADSLHLRRYRDNAGADVPPEKADTVLPIVDRWRKIMRQVNG